MIIICIFGPKVTRNLQAGEVSYSGPGAGASGAKRVALTFDDGPAPKYTPGILDVLKDHGVLATFFVLGLQVEAHPELLLRTVQEGHEIGNHSYSHRDFRQLSPEGVLQEIRTTQQLVHSTVGLRPDLVRPPYGEITNHQLRMLAEKGYRVVNWSVDPRDWDVDLNRPDTMLQTIKRELHPGAIILLHDGGGDRSRTVEALPDIIEMLHRRGYALTTVGSLLDPR